MNSPTQLDIEGALHRWDEVHYGHIAQSNVIHDTGSFLPWHRLYMRAHELLLQTECGYEGAQPYWDELSDVTNLESVANASVFDVDTGFGSGAVDSDGCITTGPFINLTLHLSQYSSSDNYCLSRSLSQTGFDNAEQANVDTCYASANYSVAWQCYKAKVHGAGHAGVGGVVSVAL
jgi:tyrosinase